MSMMNWNKGFSLLEVMISVLVLSVGLLGLAKLQGAALKTNQSATLRGQVTMLASDMFDNMRENKVEAEAGSYIITQVENPPITPTVVSGKDLVDWFNNMTAILPPGSDASIACTDIVTTDADICTTGSLFTINIFWNEFEYAGTDNNKSIQQANFTNCWP